MSLEQKLRQKAVILRRTPSSDVAEAVRQGKKFIIVENDFDAVPFGYALINMPYKGKAFRTLVPQNLLFYLANPGEGDVDDALDEIADFYDEVKEFEHGMVEDNGTSVQGVNWAVLARNTYETYLINKLTKGDEDDPGRAEFKGDALKELDLDDKFVSDRAKAIAAIALDKNPDEVRKYGVDSVLKHVTVKERTEEQLTAQEFNQITCWAGSHYEIKEEYRHESNVDYNIEYRHDRDYKVGKKVTHQKTEKFLDTDVKKLEKEIEDYRVEKNDKVGRHDSNLTRMYVNLAHIAKEKPEAQLLIQPLEVDK
ncbi:MAG: hypothetical protein ABIB71_04840 [Candidatus Woesearchaeota archaeon]